MDTNPGKLPSFSMRYNAANEELEELKYTPSDEEPVTPQWDGASTLGDSSPKRDKTSSIIDKYFKSAKSDKTEDAKHVEQSVKSAEQVNASPVKDYLHRFSGKKTGTADLNAVGEPVKDSTNEPWKIFHDFKYKIAQAVEDMKSGRAVDLDVKDKPTARDGSVSDSEDNSVACDCDKQSVCDTDNQVSSLESSIQNLSELTAPCSARKVSGSEASCLPDSHSSNSTDSHTPKNHQSSAKSVQPVEDSQIEVESGEEAFEESGSYQASDELKPETPQLKSTSKTNVTKNAPIQLKSILKLRPKEPLPTIFTYTIIFLTAIVLVNLWLLPDYYMWNGFLIGLWFFHLATLIKEWAMYKLKGLLLEESQKYVPVDWNDTIPIINIPAIEEHQPLKKLEGWVNQYRAAEYDPMTYHINKTNSVFMKLEGTSLRLSYTRSKIPKRASWDEQIEKTAFFQHRLYNLSGAKICLLPEGIVGKRHWSKKYPLCITLSGKEKVQILEREPAPLKGTEKIPGIPSEPATPEKSKPMQPEPEISESVLTVEDAKSKKKFVWKRGGRRKQSNSSQFTETVDLISKEGLRHRLIRKLHKVPDKKKDSEPTEPTGTSVIDEVINTIYMEEEQDEQSPCRTQRHQSTTEECLEDEELVRKIKDMLDFEDWEFNSTDSIQSLERWTYKESSSSKNVLFIFARTGRDKLEWHRRLIHAMASAKESIPVVNMEADNGETKPSLGLVDDCTVFRFTESEADVPLSTKKWSAASSIPESTSRSQASTSEYSPPSEPSALEPQLDMAKHEKDFWPYIYKFMQSSLRAKVTRNNARIKKYTKKKKNKAIEKMKNIFVKNITRCKRLEPINPIMKDNFDMSPNYIAKKCDILNPSCCIKKWRLYARNAKTTTNPHKHKFVAALKRFFHKNKRHEKVVLPDEKLRENNIKSLREDMQSTLLLTYVFSCATVFRKKSFSRDVLERDKANKLTPKPKTFLKKLTSKFAKKKKIHSLEDTTENNNPGISTQTQLTANYETGRKWRSVIRNLTNLRSKFLAKVNGIYKIVAILEHAVRSMNIIEMSGMLLSLIRMKVKEKYMTTPSKPNAALLMQASTETLGEPESPLWTDASWLNALVARAAYDALRNPLWAERARLRIQRKLHTLKLPMFMSPLMVQQIELGSACPRLAALRGPRADERGLWWYGELRYSGGATLTLTTQLNLMKLKEKGLEQTDIELNDSEPSSPKHTADSIRLLKPAIYDSSVDDTPESSSDEEGLPRLSDEDEDEASASSELPSGSNKKKFLKMVDKITTNKYFQQISDYKYVKRAMEGLSNTDIKLTVEMRGLHGELALNLPPPPHDRIWLGFRGNPNLTLKARPAVGARSVRIAHITNWIEQKLCKEFQRVLVLPNMEDFLVDVMTPTPVSYE